MKVKINVLLIALFFYCNAYGEEQYDPLANFLDGLQSFQSRFSQSLVDENGTELEKATGTLYLQQPGKFHWSYEVPYEQKIISDNESIWLYDVDLEQITIRAMTDSIKQTPAAVILGNENVNEHFVQIDMGVIEGYNWIELTPRDLESEYNNVRIGFNGDKLGMMILFDNLGQITRIDFSEAERNTKIDSELFNLKIPEGVDVIDDRENI